MPFPKADCFEVKNAKFPLDLALAFPNANALTMHKATNGKPEKVESNQTSEPQSLLSQFGNIEFATNVKYIETEV